MKNLIQLVLVGKGLVNRNHQALYSELFCWKFFLTFSVCGCNMCLSFLELGSGKGPMTQIRRLAAKAEQFNKCVKKAEGHLRRLGNEDDRER